MVLEQERLVKPIEPRYTAFTPRPLERLVSQPRPRSILDINCSHFVRSFSGEQDEISPPLSYRIWIEAGKHRPPNAASGNVWRNFRRQFDSSRTDVGTGEAGVGRGKIGESVAAMYPIKIPAPSEIGDATYVKFIAESPLIRDGNLRRMAMRKSAEDVAEFKRLRLKSEMRYPPLTKQGMN